MKNYYLSFDLGASSGRAIVTILKDQNKIEIDEIYRYPNAPFVDNGFLSWDFDNILSHIKKGIKLSFEKYPNIKAIGIDTWGVDYGLLDVNGNLLRNPLSYRDNRTKDIHKEVFKVIGKKRLYGLTGTQFLSFNTLYQLTYDAKYYSNFKEAKTMLLIPDLIAYYLTGEKRIEITNLSTTNFYNFRNQSVISELEELGIDKNIIPKSIKPGEVYGKIRKVLANELNIPQVPVVAVCSHDTASAILSIPINEPHIYISSGTWSLCGTLLDNPITNDIAERENYTNEIGYRNSIRFLKNIMGLWIVNQCKNDFEKQGNNLTHSELLEEALKVKPFKAFIDPDDPLFSEMDNMVSKIQKYAVETNQYVPNTIGEIIRCIYDSLAFKYRYVIERLEKIVDKKFQKIVIVGGGTNVNLLNQLTASITEKEVIIGPQEATVLGNALVLMNYDNVSIEIGKKLIVNFIGKKIYKPEVNINYQSYYQRFCEIIERNKYGISIPNS